MDLCALSGVTPQKKMLLEPVYDLSRSFREFSGFRGNKQRNAVAVFAWWLPDGRVLPLSYAQTIVRVYPTMKLFVSDLGVWLICFSIWAKMRHPTSFILLLFCITFFFSSLYWMYVNSVQLYKTVQSLNGSAKFGFCSRPRERTRFHYAALLLNFLTSGQLQLILLSEDR